jgi:toxin ParE1/3/4
VAYEVILAPRAIRDLEEIVRYIAADSTEVAARFGKLLFEKARALGDFPRTGRIVPEFRDPNIRELIVKSYRIVYRIDENALQIQIARFWHAARGEPSL